MYTNIKISLADNVK